jgi:hypothetical protein
MNNWQDDIGERGIDRALGINNAVRGVRIIKPIEDLKLTSFVYNKEVV